MRIAPPVVFGLRLSVLEGSLWSVYWSIVAGALMIKLFEALGANTRELAILAALPSLASVFGVFAARFLQARDARKPVVLWSEGVSRGLWLLLPVVLVLPGRTAVWFVLGVMAVSHSIHSAGAVAWLSWVSDLVPEQIRGLYFGLRNAIAGVLGVAGFLLASRWADRVEAETGKGPEYLRTVLILVAIAVLFAAASWLALLLQPIRRMKRFVKAGWGTLLDTLRERNGRRIVLTWTGLMFAAGITNAVYGQFFVKRLGIPLQGMAYYGLAFWGVSTLAMPAFGRFADRFGNRTLMIVGWLGVFWQPMLSVYTPNDMPHVLLCLPWTILVDAVAGGLFWPALQLAQTNLVIAQAPSEGRAGLFAVLAAMSGLAMILGTLAGGEIAQRIGEGQEFPLFGMPLDDLRFPLLLGTALRLAFGLGVFLIREPPRHEEAVTGRQAFRAVWRLLLGRAD
ncbi:MAG: MFS transporter [Planctomycetes bacterium]|jgi:MFS family permease|nr:MFS transporter [Planctomycetota bacterium]